jgi:Domain of unknown function (DUF4112)
MKFIFRENEDIFRRRITLLPMEHTTLIPQTPQKQVDPDLARLDVLAKLLDNQFRVPGTNFTFGLDGIVGLIPYLGDLAGFAVSGLLLRTMLRKGAGPVLMLRMMGNFVLDAVVGVIPFLGDLFDFGFKANRRNVALLKEYYADGKEGPDAKRSVALLGGVFAAFFIFMIWAVWYLGAILFKWAWGLF